MGKAFVTGGSRGLGFATAKQLHDFGFELVLFSKNEANLKPAAENLAAQYEVVDFADIEKTSEAMRLAIEKHGVPDVLIVAHGVMSEKMSKTLKTTNEEWRRVIAINLDSVFAIVNVIGAAMAEKRDGRIIIYSACLGRMSGPGNAGGLAPYRISKAGVNALVRNLSYEVGHGSRGVWVDAVCPNHSRTDMGGPDAPRSAEEGAKCAVWLATRELQPGETQTGLLWEDQEVVSW